MIVILSGCTKKAVDVVLLIDGSGSMTQNNFQENKDFVLDMMSTLADKPIKVRSRLLYLEFTLKLNIRPIIYQHHISDLVFFQFAASQFSAKAKVIFDFNDYKSGVGFQKLQQEQQMRHLTNTHRALEFVL